MMPPPISIIIPTLNEAESIGQVVAEVASPAVHRKRQFAPYTLPVTYQEPIMQNRILGTTMPVLEFALGPNDAVISEAGELSWMSASVQLTPHTPHAGGGRLVGAIEPVSWRGA